MKTFKLRKTIISFTVISWLVLFFPPFKPVFSVWKKYPDNPVLSPSQNGWDSVHVKSPHIIEENNQLKMWYQGSDGKNWRIGLATSNDGIHWKKHPDNPVLSPASTNSLSETDVVEPTVIHANNQYHLWFNSFDKKTLRYKIRYASSSDGIHWKKHPQPVLIGQQNWDIKGVANPSVYFDQNTFHMWYQGWSYSSGWKIGHATSKDGINWKEDPNNPLNLPYQGHLGGPVVIKNKKTFHLFYHTGYSIPRAIYHLTSNDMINWKCQDQCPVVESETQGFDSFAVTTPTALFFHNTLYLWYGASNGSTWQIGLASPEPFSKQKKPIILLPGLFGSWNKEAIIYNKKTNPSDWKLNPIAKEYKGIKQTLENLGYQENKSLYIFTYDWRKKIEQTADDLNQYIEQKITSQDPNIKIGLVGHSLGGLVGRIYLQKYKPDQINQLITVGSPHQGSALAYKPVEGGEIENRNSLQTLAEKIIVQLHKNGLKTDKEVLNEQMPVLNDLLPTYHFLKDKNNQTIPIHQMYIKNTTLLNYQPGFNQIFSQLKTLSGEKYDTLSGYKIGTRTLLDKLLDLYPDGRPEKKLFQIGDSTIISQSAKAGYQPIILKADHGQLIYTSQGIKTILNQLNISYQNDKIVEGDKTNIFPSLVFLVLSPIQLEVKINDQTYQEKDGLILIENPAAGEYLLKAKGKEIGRYTIIIGQLDQEKDVWNTIEGKISQQPPYQQIDRYKINLDPQNPSPIILDPEINFDQLIFYLSEINTNLKLKEIDQGLNTLIQGKKFYQIGKKSRTKRALQITHTNLFRAWAKVKPSQRKELLTAIAKLENLYQQTLSSYQRGIIKSRLKRNLIRQKKKFYSIKDYLLAQKQKNRHINIKKTILLEIERRLKLSQEAIDNNQLNQTEILLQSLSKLMKEIRRF